MRRKLAVLLLSVLCASLVHASGGAAAPSIVAAPAPDAWLAAERSGSSLVVDAPGERVELDLRRNEVVLPATSVVRDLDGAEVPTDGVTLLEGSVADDDRGWARVTVWDGGAIGAIVTSRGQYEIGTREGEVVVTRTQPHAAGPIEPDGAAQSCDSLMWTPRLASPTYLVSGGTDRIFENAFAVDGSYVNLHPADWSALTLGHINVIDGLFDASFDVRLAAVHLIAIEDADIPGSTTSATLASLQDHYVENYGHVARENVHLFSGRDFTNAGGQVNCVGSAGRTQLSYSVGTTLGGPFQFGPLLLLPGVAVKIAAHELAHTVSAHHHYANCVETAPNYDPFVTLDACTVMINDWGLINLTFSTLERLTVRGWVEHYGL